MGNVLQFKVVVWFFFVQSVLLSFLGLVILVIGRGLVLMLSLMVGHDFTIAVYIGAWLVLVRANDLFKLSVIVMCL